MKCGKRVLYVVIFGLTFSFLYSSSRAQNMITRRQYLEYARESANYIWTHYDEVIQRWKDRFDPLSVFGYRPPGGLLETAVIYAELFRLEANEEYANRAKRILLTYGDFRSQYPDWAVKKRPDYEQGVPALPDFFTTMRYIRAFYILDQSGRLSKEEHANIAKMIAESLRYLLRTQEWGTMNRAALRAETLAWAVRALPNHPDASTWEMVMRSIGDDNWGNWEIEDASLYNGVWLYALLGYANALGKMDQLFATPEMYYYARYYLNLMSPAGMIPDFGDANLYSNWYRFLVFFETAANQYRNPYLKWAANKIAKKFVNFNKPERVGIGYALLDCYLWGTDKIRPKQPISGSQEVMEDIVGKKIVFRTGWDDNATYLLLNYRDEGDGGLNFRDYLRDTIPVEEEKMTHGHSDENSLVMLMHKGSLLLHDGGYRDYMPSGPFGAYRADYFHNRLCVRPEKIAMGQKQGEHRYSVRDAVPGQTVLEFLRNSGAYRRVRTQKVDFIALEDVDYSRTRVIDEKMGYQWDRIITHVKDLNWFLVFDVFKARKEGYFTLANLWHTRKIVNSGSHWYETVYDSVGKVTFPENHHLTIYFPQTQYRLEGIEPIKRYYQKERMIYQVTAQYFELGQSVVMATILIPHAAHADPRKLTGQISLVQEEACGNGLGINITTSTANYLIAIKNDLRKEMVRDWRRPKYTYDAGKIRVGQLETNGDFAYVKRDGKNLIYTIVNMTRAAYGKSVLFEARPTLFGLRFDGKPGLPGVGKVRYWRGTAQLRN